MTHIAKDSMPNAVRGLEDEQRKMRVIVDNIDTSQSDELAQISAYDALMELKRLRNKQRKI